MDILRRKCKFSTIFFRINVPVVFCDFFSIRIKMYIGCVDM